MNDSVSSLSLEELILRATMRVTPPPIKTGVGAPHSPRHTSRHLTTEKATTTHPEAAHPPGLTRLPLSKPVERAEGGGGGAPA